MVAITCNFDATSSIPPARLFKSFILDDNFIPKVMPQAIKSVENIQGDGGVGTIKLITFGEGSQFKSAKHRVDGIDKENFSFHYTVIDVEGGEKNDSIESVSYVLKMEPSADGGSIIKTTSTYHTKGDAQISEEQIKGGKEKGLAMFKAAEAYLAANPDAYN